MKRALALALLCAACTKGPAPDLTASGRSRIRLQMPTVAGLVSVDYSLHFWFLGQTPPLEYGQYQVSSSTPGDELLLVLACLGSGNGLNQVRADAVLHFAGAPDVSGSTTAVFTCTPGADIPVSLVVSVSSGGPGGYVDVGVVCGGSTCTSTLALRGDEWLAVCSRSSCDSGSSVMLFSNECRGLDGTPTDVWTCGSSADWLLLGPLARAQYPLPDHDFSAIVGLAAFPRQLVALPDLSLSDAAGRLRVFGAIARPFATLVRQGGVVLPPSLEADRFTDHVALLDVPGTSGQQLLLEADDTATGGQALVWMRSGACKVPAGGVGTWSLHPIGLRLDGLSAVKVLLAQTPGGVASAQARCAVTAGSNGAAVVTCAAPIALGGTP